MIHFVLAPLSVRLVGGRLTVSRPGPAPKAKPPTLAELIEARKSLSAKQALAKGREAIAFAMPPAEQVERALAKLDQEIQGRLQRAAT